MEYGSIESKYNHMGSLLMKITLISVLPNYLPTDKQCQFKDWERSSRYRHGPTQFLPDQLTKLTTEGAEQNKRQ